MSDLIEKLQAELKSCQRVSGIKTGTIEQQDDLLNMYSERVEKYRKVLEEVVKFNDESDCAECSYQSMKAREALDE